MPITLSALIRKFGENNQSLNRVLLSFLCKQDADIEYFLHKRSVEFERLSKARTYLICDEEQMTAKGFYLENLQIYGYVTLALKVLSVPEEWSNRKRKEIDGLSSKIRGETIKDFSCYLIGQLARSSNVPHDSISGKELLQVAYDVIASAVDAVGGRYMMIECREEEKLIHFYQENGFREVDRSSDGTEVLVQMIRKIVV